jgi:hypothetical protein
MMLLTAFGKDMVGAPHGTKTLTSHFKKLAERDTQPSKTDVS